MASLYINVTQPVSFIWLISNAAPYLPSLITRFTSQLLDMIDLSDGIIVFLLVAARAYAEPITSNDFPLDLDAWHHSSAASPVSKSEARIWTTSDLESAFSVLNLGQMHSFFERLAAGNPVTVLAIGDSIVKDFGGCFHQNRLVIRQMHHAWGGTVYTVHVIRYRLRNNKTFIIDLFVVKQGTTHSWCCTMHDIFYWSWIFWSPACREHLMQHVSTLGIAYRSQCSPQSGYAHGWLNSLMHTINKTFPNPGHILINCGWVKSQVHVDVQCQVDDWYPSQYDL